MEKNSKSKILLELAQKYLASIIIISYFGAFMLMFYGFQAYWTHYDQTSVPQPIAYSHYKHVTENDIPCDYCHVYADKSKHAIIPPLSTCMDCHEGDDSDSPELKKLLKYWNDKTPVPWKQIHILPKHVYFTHKRHVKAGIDCVDCHGEVRMMDTPRQVSTLTMGWCVKCHDLHGASIDCYECHK